MSALVKSVFRNRRISPRRRVLSPFFSAIISFFLPGAAQAINGQTAKGLLTMLFWLAFTNLGVSAQNFWQKLSSKMAKEIEVIQ